METQAAEIQGASDAAKVDSAAAEDSASGSAPDAAEAGAANAQADGAKPGADAAQNKGGREQERFDKLTRERYEAQARAEIAEARREAAEARAAALEQEQAKHRQVAPDNPPTLESVGYDEAKFHAATLEYLTKQIRGSVIEEVRGEIGKGEQQRQEREIQQTWAKREADFIKSNPDYVDKVKNDPTLPIPPAIGAEIMRMESGPQIALYLAENREKADAIAKLPLNLQLRELGRIEGLLEAKKASPKTPVSQAPPPPGKVEATDAPVTARVDTADSDQLSDAEWTRRRNAQLLARKRRASN